MTHCSIYLETADDGRCMAHVLDLPGCFTRAPSRAEVLNQAPKAIGEYHAWLRRHGEPAPPADKPIEVEVAGEVDGIGPFDFRSAAALFPPDQEPVTPEEMERYSRLMSHSRADLLALVRDLPDDVLDWQADSDSISIRRLLRHVGNAEEWYVSRLVPPDTLPQEWEHDEDMPIFEFLEMERRTTLERLRQLTEEERSGVFYPTGWTDHPEEPWTARKTLRRFLEHEREHTAQIREILAYQRLHLLARLAAERAGLSWQLVGLEEETLTGVPVLDQWTAKDLLAHIAFWDRWGHRTMKCFVSGAAPDLSAIPNMDAVNAATVAEWHDRTLAKVLAELQAAHADWVAWLRTLPEEAFFRQRLVETWDWSFPGCLKVQWEHDAEHAAQIRSWRETSEPKGHTGPKQVLLAALAAAREELLSAAALTPAAERTSHPVCGEWTLKDVLAHVADWEWVGVEGLRHMAAGQLPQVEHVEDVDAWNQAHYEARRDQPWEEVWADLHTARKAMVETLNGMSQTDLAHSFTFPWSPKGTVYQWVAVYMAHDREHAQGLREA